MDARCFFILVVLFFKIITLGQAVQKEFNAKEDTLEWLCDVSTAKVYL